ncbi:hypothetical protein ACFPPD_10095 [Cohnella suwonensis]|uniref:Uncharacterized protein n=1 Tax=Cohnella suwonensis TaxID=696072 RepID=A0ABW0LTC2_9BACL
MGAVRNPIDRYRHSKGDSPLSPANVWHPGLDEEIKALPAEKLADGYPDGYRSAQAWKAALHLWNDSLGAAHEIVEDMDTPTGAALHGIVHRRRGDYFNAKDWLRIAGDHPAYHGLQARAAAYLARREAPSGPLRTVFEQIATQGNWNPYLFANAVEIHESRVGDDGSEEFLERLQRLELEAFMKYLEGRIALERAPVYMAE